MPEIPSTHNAAPSSRRVAPLLLRTEQREALYPASISKRRPPINMERDDLMLFEHEFESRLPATTLLQFENCRVSCGGLLFKGLRIFEESFGYRNMLDEWASPKNLTRFFVSNYLLKKKQTLNDEALLFIDNWSGAYFHWMTDALPRLFAVRERARRVSILLPRHFENVEFVQKSLPLFDVNAVHYLEPDCVLLCKRLNVPTHVAPSGHYNAAILAGIRKLFTGRFAGTLGNPNGRIYISRKKARVRRIINEDRVETVLAKLGFQSVCFEDYTLEEQVRIASNARFLVANHGAGLTNMLFMAAGSSVLELRKRGDAHNNCYYSLASALDLPYFYQLCDARDPSEDAYSADLTVDTERLAGNIERMITS